MKNNMRFWIVTMIVLGGVAYAQTVYDAKITVSKDSDKILLEQTDMGKASTDAVLSLAAEKGLSQIATENAYGIQTQLVTKIMQTTDTVKLREYATCMGVEINE